MRDIGVFYQDLCHVRQEHLKISGDYDSNDFGDLMTNKVVFLTVGGGFTTSFTIPSDWTNTNVIEILSAGGNGANGVAGGAAGGAGSSGGYSQTLDSTNFSPGDVVAIQLGVPGSGNGSGNDTFIKDVGGTVRCLAQSGISATTFTGAAAPGVTRAVGPALIRNGTAGVSLGSNVNLRGGAGGTGAPGPSGLGKAGGTNGASLSGGGGGGSDNGGAGNNAGSSSSGGAGGTDNTGLHSGAGATTTTLAGTGSNGAGAGGGVGSGALVGSNTGGTATSEVLWISTAGPTAGPGGGGGGGGGDVTLGGGTGGSGGYGSGGAGGAAELSTGGGGGSGGLSIIVLTYTVSGGVTAFSSTLSMMGVG